MEYSVFRELLKIIPGLEERLMESGESEVIAIAELVSCVIRIVIAHWY